MSQSTLETVFVVQGVLLDSGVGEDGLELAGVVLTDNTSPPSPSLSIAESSMNLCFLRGRVVSDLIVHGGRWLAYSCTGRFLIGCLDEDGGEYSILIGSLER